MTKEERINNVNDGFCDEEYSREDWKYEVTNGDTLLGYVDWVLHKMEAEE
jgi:hypothetical protein